MIDLTPAAHRKLDDYMKRLRGALRSSPSVEIDDVEQSVREHVDIALASAAAPVGPEELSRVLDQLGAPDRWVPEAERPIWHRVLERLRNGPEDWRLAYVAFGVFVFSLITMPIGVGFLLLFASYAASRAYVDFMKAKGEPLGARGWFVYPPIFLFLVLFVIVGIIGPAGPLVGWGVGDHNIHEELGLDLGGRGTVSHTQFDIGAASLIFGSWWILSSLAAAILLPLIRFVFAPLVDGLKRRHLLVLTGIGALSAGIGAWLVAPFLGWL